MHAVIEDLLNCTPEWDYGWFVKKLVGPDDTPLPLRFWRLAEAYEYARELRFRDLLDEGQPAKLCAAFPQFHSVPFVGTDRRCWGADPYTILDSEPVGTE